MQGEEENMKILHIYDEVQIFDEVPLNRGIYAIIFNISKCLVNKGHDVTVLIRREREDNKYIDGIRVIQLKSIKIADIAYIESEKFFGPLRMALDYSLVWTKINRFFRDNDFDIIHVHCPFVANIIVTLNKELRNRMIYTAHIGEESKRLNLNGKAPLVLKFFSPDLYLIKRVKKVVVLNENLKRRLVKEKGIEGERITVIPNGVDVNKFSNFVVDEEFKEKYNVNEPTILFVGTITPRKGVEYLVKAAKILKEEGYKSKFILVGSTSVDPEFVREIRRYVDIYRLDISITGFIPYEDLMKLYLSCDIFVLPSFEEGDPLALKDALAAGKPLIGTKVGGIPMQVRDGWNGFLVEPGNEKQLAEKIRYLIENREERKKMGRNSRKLAEEKFDWNKITERYLKVYEEVLYAEEKINNRR